MAIVKDGTQRFGIEDSPLNINGVTYIAQDLVVETPSETVDIEDDEGIPTGQVIIEKKNTVSGTLQFATNTTPIPPRLTEFTIDGANYYLQSATQTESQKQYATCSFTAVEVIN